LYVCENSYPVSLQFWIPFGQIWKVDSYSRNQILKPFQVAEKHARR
jgi:hypothetical protein